MLRCGLGSGKAIDDQTRVDIMSARYDNTVSEKRMRNISPFKAVTAAGYFIQHPSWRVRPDLSGGGSLEREDVYVLKVDPKLFSAVLDDKRLSASSFRLWHMLYGMTGKNDCCWPSISTLSERLNVDPKTIQRGVRELVDCGYITVQRGNQKVSNKYYVKPSIPMGKIPIPIGKPPQAMGKTGVPPMGINPTEFNAGNLTQEKNPLSEQEQREKVASMFRKFREEHGMKSRSEEQM